MSSKATPYDHPNQVKGREPHAHNQYCMGWNGELDCNKQEGLPNNQTWDKENIASPSPIDRATHVARRVKSSASELIGSLRGHFDGGEPEAPKPFVPPTFKPAPKQAPEALPMHTDESSYKDRLLPEGGSMAHATRESFMGGEMGPITHVTENAARRLKNHVAGAATGGSHLMTWTRGDTYSDQQTRNKVQGANGESVGGESIKMAKPGDVRRRDPQYESHTQATADHFNEKSKGAKIQDFLFDLKHRVLPTAGAGTYHVEHRVTLTREGELTHKTKSMTLHGAELSTRNEPGGKSYEVFAGQHQEGTPDSRGVAPHVAINPDHIQKVEIHVRKGS